MRRAFLCHASKDKGYVDIIAKRLGRAKVVYDEMHFEEGVDFREAIQSGLDDTRVFVFFVSNNSLASVWCKHEVDEAEFRKLSESLSRCLTIIVDPDINFDDLPKWMKRSKAVIQTRPTQATRDIQHALFTTAPTDSSAPFIGRQRTSIDFARNLAHLGATSPHLLVASGLEGIGRRSYLKRVTADNLALDLGPFFFVDETHDLIDVYLWALDETAEYGSRIQLADEIKAFNALTDEEKVSETISCLRIMCDNRCLPCIVDEGGLLEDSGKYRSLFAMLISSFLADHRDHYVAIIHRRKPNFIDLAQSEMILYQRITPLEAHETTLLFSQLLKRSRNEILSDLVEHIGEFLEGYPPAIYFAANYAEEYGLDALAEDTVTLVDFKAKRFLRYLTDIKLEGLDWLIAQYLAAERLMPLEAIASALDHQPDEVARSLRSLIDHNLVVVFDDKYGISGPIKDTVHRSRGYLTTGQYENIRKNLTKAFWSNETDAPTIEVVDATLHAVAMSGSTEFNPYEDLVRASTVHRLANESYRRQEWKAALEYAIRAEEMDPSRIDVSRVKFKAMVQLEDWNSASKVLDNLRDRSDRMAFYLEGFMLRKKRLYKQACKAFQSALDTGDNSFPVHRDYADCLNRIGDHDTALEHIKWVLDRDSENIFILDLMCRICIDGGKFTEAEEVLETLARCDIERRFVHHRRAKLLASKKEYAMARDESTLACETGFAPYESHALRCGILIELNEFQMATDELKYIEEKFGKTVRRDVHLGLKTKLLFRQGMWREAMTIWEQLEDKGGVGPQAVKAYILRIKSQDMTIPFTQRQDAAKEAASIEIGVKQYEEYRAWSETGL